MTDECAGHEEEVVGLGCEKAILEQDLNICQGLLEEKELVLGKKNVVLLSCEEEIRRAKAEIESLMGEL